MTFQKIPNNEDHDEPDHQVIENEVERFNPKMRMIRTKTLMQGDDCCNNRYIIEA